MTQYIDKSAVIVEIKRRIEAHKETLKNCDSNISKIALKGSLSAYQSLLYYFLNNTVEVKEVDLGKTLISFQGRYAHENSGEYPTALEIAKHFFGLGIKAQKGE